MGINFSTSDRWIKSGSATNSYQNGSAGDKTTATAQNLGFYTGATEHVRFDDNGIVSNQYGAPAYRACKTEAGATGNQAPIPIVTQTDVRSNAGTRGSQTSFVAPVTGTYRWSGGGLHGGGGIISPYKNGARFGTNGVHVVSDQVSYLSSSWEIVVDLTAGDHLQLESWNSGNVWGDNGWTTMTVSFIR